MTDMVPERVLDARSASFSISHLVAYQDFQHKADYDPDAVWLFDTIIPPFQRKLVWTEAQMARFINSIWAGIDIGRYVVNDAMDAPWQQRAAAGCSWHPTDRWLIDGQQRLTAIQYYLTDRFPIRGKDGHLHLWSDLSEVDRRQFGHKEFSRGIVKIYDEHNLRVLYDLMNFGGVAHEASERALPEDQQGAWRP
jgi:hypothetical protein